MYLTFEQNLYLKSKVYILISVLILSTLLYIFIYFVSFLTVRLLLQKNIFGIFANKILLKYVTDKKL